MNKPMENSDLMSARGSVTLETQQRLVSFLMDYCHQLDDNNIEAWPGFFCDGSVYQVTTRENHEAGYPLGIVLCEGLGMMEDRVRALRTANIYESHVYCHLLGQPEIRVEGNDTYRVRSNFTLHRTMYDGKAELFATGKYLDIVVDTTSRMYFKERRVILDSRRIDTLIVTPL